MAVHGGSGVSFGVIEQLRRARPQAKFLELVHRLDRETSGVLLLAKKRSALTALQDQFRARDTGKTYAALVLGAWPESLKVIDVPLHKYLKPDGERRVRTATADDEQAKRSITLVKVVQRYRRLHAAGREHQDRAHAPDPRAPGALGPPDRRRRQVRRLRVQQVAGARHGAARACASTACSCMRGGWPSTTRPAARRIELEAPLPAPACRALLQAALSDTCLP